MAAGIFALGLSGVAAADVLNLGTTEYHDNTATNTQSYSDYFSFSLQEQGAVTFDYSFHKLLSASKLSIFADTGSAGPDKSDRLAKDTTKPIQPSTIKLKDAPASWSFSSLAAGKYYLLVDSSVKGKTKGDFTLTKFSVSPVPEPNTYALMAAGFGLIGFMSFRRQRYFG